MNKRRWVIVGLFFAISLLTVLLKPSDIAVSEINLVLELSGKPQPVPGNVVPAQILACIPTEGTKYDLVGTTRDREISYYLLAIYEYTEASKEQWDVVIEQNQAGCLLLHHLGSGLQPLKKYMPKENARQLELQRYEQWIKKVGSKKQFQKIFVDRASDPGVIHYLSQEQIWALQKLGIQIPKTYRVLNSDAQEAKL